ncbi:MAG: diacylglycerol kinase family protein [Chloroflexota bacterium]
MRTSWLIHNPSAGWFPTGPLLGRAVNVLARSGWDVEVVELEPGQDVADVASAAVGAGCEAVFVAGGDGTVGRVAGVLAGTSTALGVLPSGTANVWAQELGLPRLGWSNWFALEESAAQLANGDVRLVDVGECNDRAFLMWAGLGLDAHIVKSIEPRGRWEKSVATPHYAILAVWNSWNWTGLDLRVEAEGKHWEDRYLVAICSNIRSYAGGLLELAPEARVDDGLLDFWLIAGRSLTDAVLRVVQVFRGTHIDAPGVVHFQAARASFEAGPQLTMQLDGEPYTMKSPAQLKVRRRVLRALVPRESQPRVFTRTPSSDTASG